MKLKCQHLQLMKEKNKIMSKEKAIEIVKLLTNTIDKMSLYDGLYSDMDMFKGPRAKRSDLIQKRKEVKRRIKNYE